LIYLEDMTTNQHYRIVKVRGKWGRWGKFCRDIYLNLNFWDVITTLNIRITPIYNLPHLPHLPHQRFIEL